jgi:hypothetical protein
MVGTAVLGAINAVVVLESEQFGLNLIIAGMNVVLP